MILCLNNLVILFPLSYSASNLIPGSLLFNILRNYSSIFLLLNLCVLSTYHLRVIRFTLIVRFNEIFVSLSFEGTFLTITDNPIGPESSKQLILLSQRKYNLYKHVKSLTCEYTVLYL